MSLISLVAFFVVGRGEGTEADGKAFVGGVYLFKKQLSKEMPFS